MKKKDILTLLLVLFVFSGGGIGFYFYYQGTHYLKTEDARIAGDQYKVMPQISAEITNIDVKEGDILVKSEAIAEQDTTNLDPGMIRKSIIRAPINGTVIKLLSKEHEIAAAGQPVAIMMDMNQLYVSANIEETNINKVKVGQDVDVSIDSLNGETIPGKVRDIGKATNSTLSLVPAVNTSGNFNKVTQKIPIEIAILKPEDLELIPGSNVEVTIHIK
ncbi:secretion protein HlyD [Lysinibacillus sp. PLM2]|nr:secretion protein HlyD [Lysinibacillus sp. PLM2]